MARLQFQRCSPISTYKVQNLIKIKPERKR
nr:MAG TPA: hypothetical protein [Caudoviricetes sp.]